MPNQMLVFGIVLKVLNPVPSLLIDRMLEQALSHPHQKIQGSLKLLGPLELHNKFNFSNL
jgi:hypothetical protein